MSEQVEPITRIRNQLEQIFKQLATYKYHPNEEAVRELFKDGGLLFKELCSLIGSEEKATDITATIYNRCLNGDR